MTTRDAALARVLADPDSDAARLELARILQAADDPQGELIAAQTEAASELRKYGPTPDFRRLTLRSNALLAQHQAEWTAPVRSLAENPILLRGLVEGGDPSRREVPLGRATSLQGRADPAGHSRRYRSGHRRDREELVPRSARLDPRASSASASATIALVGVMKDVSCGRTPAQR